MNIGIPIGGMANAAARVDRAALNIARETATPEAGMVEDVVELKSAGTAFKANAAVVRVVDELYGALLDTKE